MPIPFTFRSTAPLVDKDVACKLAKQVAEETCRKFIFPREDLLAGRLQEFRDSDHPNFLAHVDNFFLNRTNISPAQKFNWLAGQLSDKMEALWKANNRRYNNALNQYFKLTKRQLRTADGHAGAEAAKEELQDALKLQAVIQEEKARQKRYRNFSASLRNFYRRAGSFNNNQGIPSLIDPATNQRTEDRERILNIFRDHHATKCTDPQANPTEAAASDPPLSSDLLEGIAERYGYPVGDHFKPMPQNEEYPTGESLGITKEELHKLIKDLKNRTAPGRSGLDKTVLIGLSDFFRKHSQHTSVT